MASGPITSWQIDGEAMERVTDFILGGPKSLQMVTAAMKLKETCSFETVETVADFNFGGSKITADGDCSHEIKRCLLLGRKVMTNLDSIFKSRDITLPTKVHLVKAMIFRVVIY